jgi:anti-sigma factor RsiW
MNDHRTHAQFRDLLAEAAAGELSAEGREELERHLQQCNVCRQDYESIVAVEKLLASKKPVSVSDDMLREARTELRARIRIERSSSGRWTLRGVLGSWLGAPAPRYALVGALSALLGLGLGYLFFRTPAQEAPLTLQTAMALASGQGGSQITAVRFVDADASDGEVELAFQAVRPMRLKGSPNDPAIQKLLAYALVNESNVGIRLRTVSTLTENPHPQTDPEIRSALVKVIKYDTNPGVRKQAMAALGKLPLDGDVKQALLYVLANDPNEGLRVDAINALLPDQAVRVPEDEDVLQALKSRLQNENNNYIRLRTKAALQEVQQ